MSTETTKDTLPFTCTPAYDRNACKGCVCSTCYEQEFCDRCSSCVEQGHRKERCNAYEGAYNYWLATIYSSSGINVKKGPVKKCYLIHFLQVLFSISVSISFCQTHICNPYLLCNSITDNIFMIFINIILYKPDRVRITRSTSLFSSSWIMCRYVFMPQSSGHTGNGYPGKQQ